jgi:hypothetical protein
MATVEQFRTRLHMYRTAHDEGRWWLDHLATLFPAVVEAIETLGNALREEFGPTSYVRLVPDAFHHEQHCNFRLEVCPSSLARPPYCLISLTERGVFSYSSQLYEPGNDLERLLRQLEGDVFRHVKDWVPREH